MAARNDGPSRPARKAFLAEEVQHVILGGYEYMEAKTNYEQQCCRGLGPHSSTDAKMLARLMIPRTLQLPSSPHTSSVSAFPLRPPLQFARRLSPRIMTECPLSNGYNVTLTSLSRYRWTRMPLLFEAIEVSGLASSPTIWRDSIP